MFLEQSDYLLKLSVDGLHHHADALKVLENLLESGAAATSQQHVEMVAGGCPGGKTADQSMASA